MSRRYNRSRSHAIRQHQSGEPIADRIAGAILLTGLIAILHAMVSYANHRDAKALNSYLPQHMQPVSPDAGRTLFYLDELPPNG